MKIVGYDYSYKFPKYFTVEVSCDESEIQSAYELYENKCDVIILEKPEEGYYYKLQEDSRRKCIKCGGYSEFYVIAPYGSKFDGEAICANCIDR